MLQQELPLDDNYSYDAENGKAQLKRTDCALNCALNCALIENLVLEYLPDHPQATQVEIAKAIGKSRRAVQDAIAALKAKGLLDRQGAKRKGYWIVRKDQNE